MKPLLLNVSIALTDMEQAKQAAETLLHNGTDPATIPDTLHTIVKDVLYIVGCQCDLALGCEDFTTQPGRVTFAITMTHTDREAEARRKIWEDHFRYTGLTAEDLGKTIVLNGKTYTISWFRSAAPRNCIELTAEDGKRRFTDVPTVLYALKRERPPLEEPYPNAAKICNELANEWGIPVQFGQDINWNGKHLRVLGIRRNAAKYPIRAVDINNGKVYRLTADAVAEHEKTK